MTRRHWLCINCRSMLWGIVCVPYSYPEGFGFESHKKHQRRILSHLFPLKTSHTTTLSQVPDSDTELMSQVESVWSKILTERRTILEDTYKIELSANQTQRMGPVSMSDISPLWEETALKVWQLYTGNVKRKLTSTTQRKDSVISSAFRSVHKRLGRETGTVEVTHARTHTHTNKHSLWGKTERQTDAVISCLCA
ncbi:unnamed protein product [Oncorhynchus mykiss]|uniref:Uncharacterized protein n=1 Tax=Oncorhynchus mykiss TaxID=8022 RepID=A0A060Z2D1_ONCMY|nr:unnamed protein product [Oncorhynchus mykiss]